MKTKHFIFLINFYTFCVGTVFILPVMIPYYQDHLGLTFRQFLIGEAVFAAVVIAMEVPSGWLSDVWSRKRTLLLGCGTAMTGYSLLLTADSFASAVLAQATLGIGVAFNSGTVTSLLYDTLAERDKVHLYRRLEGKRHGVGLYAVACGAVIGGFLYAYDMRLPLVFDIGSLICAFIAVLFMPEPDRVKRGAQANPLSDMIETVRYALHGHKEIAGIILVSTVLFCTTKMALWVQQPYMQLVDIPVQWFGAIIACGFVFGGTMGHFGHKFEPPVTNKFMLKFLVGFVAVCMTIAVAMPHYLSIALILMISGVWGFGFPFVQNAINKHADPARRATILSTLGLLVSVLFIPFSLMAGYLEEHYSILHTIGYLAMQLVVMTSFGFWLWARGQ